MAKSHGLCVFCNKEVNTLGVTLNGNYSPKFLQYFSRHLNIRLKTKVDITNGALFSCSECFELVDAFCYLFSQQEILRLQLECRVRQLFEIMGAAPRTDNFRVSESPNQYKNEFDSSKISKLRGELLSGCKKKLNSSLPKVLLEKSVDMVENVPEPFVNLEILQWLLTVVAVVNLSLPFQPQAEVHSVFQPHRKVKNCRSKNKEVQTDSQIDSEDIQCKNKDDFLSTMTLHPSKPSEYKVIAELNEQFSLKTIEGKVDDKVFSVPFQHDQCDFGFKNLITCEDYEGLQVEAEMIAMNKNEDTFSLETMSQVEAMLATEALVVAVPYDKEIINLTEDVQGQAEFEKNLPSPTVDNSEDQAVDVGNSTFIDQSSPKVIDGKVDAIVGESVVNFDTPSEKSLVNEQKYFEVQLISMNYENSCSKIVSEKEAVSDTTPVSVPNSPYTSSAHDKSVSCHICNLTLENSVLLTLHLKSDHQLKTSFKCPQCQHQFSTAGLFRQHMRMAHNTVSGLPGAFQCDICYERFATVAILRMHKFCAHVPRNRGLKLFQQEKISGPIWDRILVPNSKICQPPALRVECQIESPLTLAARVEESSLKSGALVSSQHLRNNQELLPSNCGGKMSPTFVNLQEDDDLLRASAVPSTFMISSLVDKENRCIFQRSNDEGSRKRKSNLNECERNHSKRKPI